MSFYNTWNQVGIDLLNLLQDRTPGECELGHRAAEFWTTPKAGCFGQDTQLSDPQFLYLQIWIVLTHLSIHLYHYSPEFSNSTVLTNAITL